MTVLPTGAARGYAANEKLNVALVGVGGRGSWFVDCIPRIGENVVAMCDVNEQRAVESFKKLPDAPKYDDFRRMLDEGKEIEAVVVATPDRTEDDHCDTLDEQLELLVARYDRQIEGLKKQTASAP